MELETFLNTFAIGILGYVINKQGSRIKSLENIKKEEPIKKGFKMKLTREDVIKKLENNDRNFNNLDLSNLDLSNANLSNANLENANLRYTNLRYANLYSDNLENANLENANLSNTNLSNANLRYANLYNANLSNANLKNADSSNANLSNAYLRYADLYRTDLFNADLSNANLSNANLLNANLTEIKGKKIVAFHYIKHFAYYCDGILKIGCESKKPQEWLECYKELGKKHDYTEQEIEMYLRFINMCKDLI